MTTILIVEDDPNIALYYSEYLDDKYCISIVSTGLAAIQYLQTRSASVDLILLDFKLPDVSGLEVLRKIKEQHPGIPVIFITGYGNEEIAVKSFRYGAIDYLKKPFQSSELLSKIKFYSSLRSAKSGDRKRVVQDAAVGIDDNHHACPPARNYFRLQKAIRYIDDNYVTAISLDSAAKQACMSRHHFSRTFKKALNITYQEYLNKRRTDKAKELLRSSKSTITEIAFIVGYNDLTHFERVFKRLSGDTPSRYRKYSQPAESNISRKTEHQMPRQERGVMVSCAN